MPWKIEDLREDHLPGAMKLARKVLGERHSFQQEAFWRWKHFDNPFGPSLGAVAVAGGEIVGIRLLLPWHWARGSGIVRSLRAVDTATDPAWQRRGVFHSLTSYLLDDAAKLGFEFVFNTPNPKSLRGYLKLGWQDLGRLPISLKPPKIGTAVKWALGSGPSGGASTIIQFGRPVSELLQETDLERFLPNLLTDETRLRTPRTREYLSWRYAATPGVTYGAVWDIKQEEGAAVIFRTQQRYLGPELTICEILASRGSGEERLARVLSALVKNRTADYAIALHAQRSHEQRMLRRTGFLPGIKVGPRLAVRPLTTTAILRQSDWSSSLGDFELF